MHCDLFEGVILLDDPTSLDDPRFDNRNVFIVDLESGKFVCDTLGAIIETVRNKKSKNTLFSDGSQTKMNISPRFMCYCVSRDVLLSYEG